MFQNRIDSEETRLATRRSIFAWKLVAILAAGVGMASCGYLRAQPMGTAVTRTGINTPIQNRFNDGTTPAISPDGRQVVFSAISDKKVQLWLRPLDSPTAHPLEGTENGYYPFWSPDSKSIGFFVWDKLKKLDVAGGPATTIADAGGRGGTWSKDGVIVFSSQSPDSIERLKQVAASGGTVRPATRANANTPSQSFPWFLPDGRHFLYLSGNQAIRIGSLDSPGEDRTLVDAVESFAIYSQGYILFMRGALTARPFDAKRMEFTGEAVPVGEQVRSSRGHAGVGEFSASTNGVLVYQSGLLHLRLTWKDRAGNRLGTVGDPGNVRSIRLLPDRKTAAVTLGEASGPNVGIWLYDMLRGLRSRFTSDAATDVSGVWSPDGRTIVFSGRSFNLYRKPADGSGNAELLYADELWKGPGSFSPDGKYLAYSATTGGTDVRDDSVVPRIPLGIWILPDPLGTPGAAKPYPLAPGGFAGGDPQFSPDGRWIAYDSAESGEFEVYVVPFPGPGPKRRISMSGGEAPRWRADGKELFYIAPESRLVAGEAGDIETLDIARGNRLMAAEVDTQGDAFEVKKVVPLFVLEGECGYCYDVSADGQRFLVPAAPEGETSQQLTVVQNWTAEIERGK